jgi:DNA polymerase-3 subunit gamma/tau
VLHFKRYRGRQVMAQALYRKWRPQTFDEVVGQEHVLQTLRNAISANRIAHAYLFSGPRGTGKTTMARLLAKAVNCTNPDPIARPDNTCEICTAITDGRLLDLIELDAASNRGIDEIRDLRDKINFAPGQARYKVYIIDEVHMLTEPAFNALLKTLEEPPPHAIFVLATTDPQKVPATIVSRCQPFSFRRLSLHEIVARLQHLVDEEHLNVEPAALALIARQATGALRDAVSLLDQLAASGIEITAERAQAALGMGSLHWVSVLVEAICDTNIAAGLETINRAIDEGADARQFARQIVEHLRSLMLMKMGDAASIDLPGEQRSIMTAQADRIDPDRLINAVKLFNQAASDLRGGWQPQLPLELALIESIRHQAPGAAAIPSNSKSIPAAAKSNQSAPVKPAEPQVDSSQKTDRSRSMEPARTEPVLAAMPATFSLALNEINAHWADILGEVKSHSIPTEALMKSCHVFGVEGATIILSWPTNALKEKFESDKVRRLVEGAIGAVLTQKVLIRSQVDDPVLREAVRLGAKVTPVSNR